MRKIALSAALLLVVLAAPVFANMSSRYAVSGRGPDGSTYTGAMRFTAEGQIYRLEEASGDNKWAGLAIENKDFLALALIGGDGEGFLGIYRRAGDSWVGTLTGYGDDPLGFEVLYNGDAPNLPKAGRANSGKLAGKYQISGTNPDGTSYTGEVEVTPDKPFFNIDRSAGTEGLGGTALGFDGALVFNVNKGDKRAPIGVLGLFIPDGNGFLGIWAKAGSQKLGAERWVHK